MRWHELTPAEKKRRLVRWGNARELVQLGGDPPLEARAAPLRTLAGIALHEEATADDERLGSIAGRIDETRATLERTGRWEDEWEWRISAYRTDRLERIEGGYRASSESNASWRADFRTFAEAYEAMRVFASLDISLHYALGWTAGRTAPRKEPDATRPVAETYLRRLASETAPDAGELTQVAVERTPRPRTWREDSPAKVLAVRAAQGTLAIDCVCVSARRADEFARVFAAVIDDLLDVLEWEPLAR
jgi:hypothetical protein